MVSKLWRNVRASTWKREHHAPPPVLLHLWSSSTFSPSSVAEEVLVVQVMWGEGGHGQIPLTVSGSATGKVCAPLGKCIISLHSARYFTLLWPFVAPYYFINYYDQWLEVPAMARLHCAKHCTRHIIKDSPSNKELTIIVNTKCNRWGWEQNRCKSVRGNGVTVIWAQFSIN